MRLFTGFLLTVLPATAFSRALTSRQSSVDAWVAAENPIARTSLFRNIGSHGEFAQGASPGAVIASPSTKSPDYYYQWTRDAAMVFKVLLNSYIQGNSSIDAYIREFVTESNKLQRTNNPSGGYTTGGIGEPKFHVNGAPFTGSWGRPQTDGPAIRATVLTKYANMLLDGNNAADVNYVKTTLYDSNYPTNSVIKSDLEYVANYWKVNGFDLWEEVNGLHFFNLMVQRRSLIEGAELANRLGDSGAAGWYTQQANDITAKLPQFWNSQRNFLIATLGNSRSGEDCGTLLGALHGNGKRGFGLYQASSDQVLMTLKVLVDIMKPLYRINSQSDAPGIAIGRYPSDVYDGVGESTANPWFICTFTVAEVLYTAINEPPSKGSIQVTSLSLPFYQKFLSSTSTTTYAKGSANYNTIVAGIRSYADSFVATGRLHVANNGSISEQFDRNDGFMKGARDLTWSYASFLTMRWAKNNQVAY